MTTTRRSGGEGNSEEDEKEELGVRVGGAGGEVTGRGQGRARSRRRPKRRMRRERKTTKVHCTYRGDDDYKYYNPPHPESEAVTASSNSEPAIPFTLGPRCAGSPPISKG